jgi:hypothetical protein
MVAPLAFSLPWQQRLFGAEPDAVARCARALPQPTWWQRPRGWALTGRAARIARLLSLQVEAAAAEGEGRFDRADFLWRETYALLRACWSDDAAWADAARRLMARANTVPLTGPSLRVRWSLETALHRHCAFFNGHLAGDGRLAADSRAFFHGERIAELFEIGGNALGAARHLLPEVTLARIEALRSEKRFDEAVAEGARLVRREPGEPAHAERLADLHFERAVHGLKGGDDEADNRADAARLRGRIDEFEWARRDHPRAIGFYRGLARCHRILAVSLANAGELAQALGPIRMARKYDPRYEDAERLENELIQLMSQLQEQVAELKRQLVLQPGTHLNAEGLKLMRNADSGLASLEECERSELAQSLSEEFGLALDREVWSLVGQPPPADRWDERARALHAALLAVLAQPPSQPEDIGLAWHARAAEHADLRDCDARPICDFLRRRLFSAPSTVPEPATAVPPVPHEAVPAVPTRPRRASLEPFGLWLLAPRDWRVKLQVLVAALAVAVTWSLQAAESQHRQVRDRAYQSLRGAVTAGSDLGVVRAAEAFFSVGTRAADGREGEVQQHYDHAFARWFVADGHRLDAGAQSHVERYRGRQQPTKKATP